MKTVRPRFIPAHSIGHNASMGASYQANCPHCRQRNLAWEGETNERKTSRVNKCPHFDGFTKTGAFRFFKGLPIIEANKGTSRWFKCVYEFPYRDKPDYRFSTHASAVEEWYEEARRFSDCVDERDIEPTVFAIKAPPAEWLAQARTNALARSEGALKRADFLRAELARHYPGHK